MLAKDVTKYLRLPLLSSELPLHLVREIAKGVKPPLERRLVLQLGVVPTDAVSALPIAAARDPHAPEAELLGRNVVGAQATFNSQSASRDLLDAGQSAEQSEAKQLTCAQHAASRPSPNPPRDPASRARTSTRSSSGSACSFRCPQPYRRRRSGRARAARPP